MRNSKNWSINQMKKLGLSDEAVRCLMSSDHLTIEENGENDFTILCGQDVDREHCTAMDVNEYLLDLWCQPTADARRVSLDNGETLDTVDAVSDEDIDKHWDALVNVMDDGIREEVHAEFAPCSNRKFLTEYCNRADADLVIG